MVTKSINTANQQQQKKQQPSQVTEPSMKYLMLPKGTGPDVVKASG
jgi:hypothetical protein